MTVILGEIENSGYFRENERTEHLKKRKSRTDLVIEESRLISCFLVLREEDKVIQVHCLYEDASLFVFNKETKRIITVMLLSEEEVEEYLKFTEMNIQDNPVLMKCAKLNRENYKRDSEDISRRKRKIISMGSEL